jgi:putative transposase
MQVHSCGYDAWKAEPQSSRAKDDQRLAGLLKQAWLESSGAYGYRKLTPDMRDLCERRGKHRVARLHKLEGLRSQTGYRRRPGVRGGKPAVVAPNHLKREFTVTQPNRSWMTDSTYMRMHESRLYLAVVVSCSSAKGGLVDGQPHRQQLGTGHALMALWRRRPANPVTMHSDKGCQFTGHE